MPKYKLQQHQQRVVQRITRPGQTGLVVAHGVGSGKTLTSIAAQKQLGVEADVVLPASLRQNYEKERRRFGRDNPKAEIISAQRLGRGGVKLKRPLLIVDEAHWARNPKTKLSQRIRSTHSQKRLLLTASPIYNHPADIAPLVNVAAGKPVLPESRKEFERRYFKRKKVGPGIWGRIRGIKPGEVVVIPRNAHKELVGVASRYVDYYPGRKTASASDYPRVRTEIVKVPMTRHQQQVHDYILGKAPAWVRFKVRRGLPPNKREARKLNAFLTGTRQVSNTTRGYSRKQEEPKIDTAFRHAHTALKSDPTHKVVVYSGFVRSGIAPYRKRLQRHGIPYVEFTGSMPKHVRKRAVSEFNKGKKRVLLISRAGAEGLDLKGTRQIQILEPHWNEEMITQVIGRGARFRSHAHLPEHKREVVVRRYLTTRRPKGVLEHLRLRRPGMSTDEYMHNRAQEKQRLNQQFLQILREGTAKHK